MASPYTFAFRSEAAAALSPTELERLFTEMAASNVPRHRGHRFLQRRLLHAMHRRSKNRRYESSKERTEKSKLHRRMTLLLFKPIKVRSFQQRGALA
jgi:hypothetical protein